MGGLLLPHQTQHEARHRACGPQQGAGDWSLAMELFHHSGSAWPQGSSPTDCRLPGAMGGAFPHTWAVNPPVEPYASSSAAFQESPAFSPASSPVDPLVPDTPTVQENEVDQSRAKKPKTRTTFSQEQLRLLRSDFAVSRYITRERGYQLAELLGLNYKQVKTWFQNQRLKVKRSQTVPVCRTHDQDHRLPQLEPAIGPQGLSLPSSFHMDPVNNHPENYSEWSDQVSEDWLQNYGEAPSPYQMAFQPPYSGSSLEALVGHTGWSYPIGSQTSGASYAPAPMRGHLPNVVPSELGNWVRSEQSSSDGSEAGSASAPSPHGGAPGDQSYPLMGPVLSAL